MRWCTLLRYLGPGVVACVVAIPASFAASVTTEPRTDRPGSDYRTLVLPAADPALCAEACTDDANCQAYTYVNPGVQGPEARCYLKSPAPAPQPSDCCVSGIKMSHQVELQRRVTVDPTLLQQLGRQQVVLPGNLSSENRSALDRVVVEVKQGDLDAMRSHWGKLIESLHGVEPNVDVSTLVLWVLRESYLESAEGLSSHAEKVNYFSEIKRQIRDELRAAREHRSEVTHLGVIEADVVTYIPTRYQPGAKPILERHSRKLGPTSIDAYIRYLESQLDRIDDDGQLSSIELQSHVQKQQHTLQLMSKVSKQLHDTAVAVIRKLG